ncbi:MAG TPA: hypothetical protein VFX11_02790 [Candidatus Kapabacteria bacterium]|nr:hypothetical protein [Candidatus Kapabacteria bacterium]
MSSRTSRFTPITLLVIAMLMSTTRTLRAETPAWDLLLSAEHIHQEFDTSDADLDTLTFSPAVSLGSFSLSASLPWQKVSGVFFLDIARPNVASLCSLVQGLTPLQKLRLVRNGTLTLAQLQYCNQYSGEVTSIEEKDSATGAGDIELFASYYLPPLTDTTSASLGLGYKHDNGDADSGLGTGTRDLFAETALQLQPGPLRLLLTLGHNWLQHNDTGLALNDYGYGSLDAGVLLLQRLTLGIEYHYQQAGTDVTEDLDYLVWYGELDLPAGWGGRLFLTDYLDADNLPREEFGGSLSWHF